MIQAIYGDGSHIWHTRMYAWTAGAGMAGLALHDVRPEGRELFVKAKEFYERELCPARQLQGGAIHNGLSYGPNYMMFPLIQFLEAARSGAGIDYFHGAKGEWLDEMGYYLIYCIRPDMEHVKFADHATQDPAKHFRFMLDVFASEYKNGYAAEMGRRISERFKTSGYHAEWIYLFFAFYNPDIKPKPLDELPTARVFSQHGVGHVFWRSDWSADGPVVVPGRAELKDDTLTVTVGETKVTFNKIGK